MSKTVFLVKRPTGINGLKRFSLSLLFGMELQWNPINMDTKGTCLSAHIKLALSKYKVKDTCVNDKKTKADISMGTLEHEKVSIVHQGASAG